MTEPMLSDVVTLVTKVSPVKKVFIAYDTLRIDHPLSLTQVEATIDALSTKLASLRYATTIENLQPLTVVSQKVVLTLFQTILPLSTSLQACKNLELEPLSLSNLPIALKTSIPILLHYEISVGTDTVLCISHKYTLREENCLDDILNRTHHLLPFHSRDELQTYLLREFVGTVAHIIISNDEAVFTVSPFSNSACIGAHNPNKMSKKAILDVKLLHEHFYEKLNTAFTDIYDYLDLVVAHLEDTIHSISSESFVLPIPLQDKDRSIEEILNLVPLYLENHPNRVPTYPTFEEFFSSSVKESPDFLVGNLSATDIFSLTDRQRSILYSSLLQFKKGLTDRMAEYMKMFNMYQTSLYLPRNLLFAADQNPSTFLYLIRSMLPTIDENLLTEVFIIVQNEKASLLQDISFLFGKNVTVNHLTRSRFSDLTRKQWKKYTSTAKGNQDLADKESQLNFLHNYHNLSEKVFSPTDTAPFLGKTAEVHLENYSVPNIFVNLLSPGHLKPRSVDSSGPTQPPRQKRSWGTFWGGLLSLASQEDLDKIYSHELEIGNNELSISTTLRNITDSNSHLLNSVQTVTASVNSLLAREKNLFSDIHSIMSKEELTLENFNAVFTTLDRSTSLISEYLTLQTQTTLLFNSVQKLQSLTLSVLTGTLDVSQIPTGLLRPHLTANLRLSVSRVTASFIYTPEGYQIRFLIPKLSQPYSVYYLQTIPFYRDGLWLQPSIPDFVVMNSIHETLQYEEVKNVCTPRDEDYLCPPDTLHVNHKPEASSCPYQLVLFKLTASNVSLRNCFQAKIVDLKAQRFIIKEDELVISSPVEDLVQYHCVNRKLNRQKKLLVGVNKLSVHPGCHYETSQLQIRNSISSSVRITEPRSDRGLAIIQDLDSLDSLLESQLPEGVNLTSLQFDLEKYGTHLLTADSTIDRISKQVNDLDSIRTLSEFSPISLDLSRPFHTSNWVAFMFWIMVIMLLALIWSIIRHFGWYAKFVSPIFTQAGRLFIHCCCNYGRQANRVIQRTYSSMWDVCEMPVTRVEFRSRPSVSDRLAAAISRPTGPVHQDSATELEPLRSEPPLSASPADCTPSLSKTHLTSELWKPILATYGNWQMKAVLKDAQRQPYPIFFDPLEDKVTDCDGKTLQNIVKPKKEDIEHFYKIVKSSKLPPTTIEDGVIHHRNYPFLYFNTEKRMWINRDTLSTLPGLNPPEGFGLRIPDQQEDEK